MQPKDARPRRFTRVLLERERPDVVLLNNLAAFNGARYARVQAQVAPQVPIVAVVHEWRAIRSKEGERFERFHANAQAGLDAVAAVVFPSEHTRLQGAGELGLRYPERALVINNPIQPAFADALPRYLGAAGGGRLRRQLQPSQEPGGPGPGGGAAAGDAADDAGTGAREGADRGARRRARNLGPRLVPPFSGGKRHVGDVADVMRSAEVLCLPSRSESFALVIVEALAMGTPVAGFGPTLTEIQDRLGIDVGEPIFDPTPENVAAAIESVRARSWDRERLRRAAIAEFSTQAVTRRYSRLLRSVGRGR